MLWRHVYLSLFCCYDKSPGAKQLREGRVYFCFLKTPRHARSWQGGWRRKLAEARMRQEWSRNYTRLKSLKGFFWWLTSYSKVLFPKGSIASPKHYHHLETKWHLQIITCNWRLQDIKTSGNVWSFWQITENFENSWTDGKPLQLLILFVEVAGFCLTHEQFL